MAFFGSNRANTGFSLRYLSYWQVLRWHRSHLFWLVLLLALSGFYIWNEKQWCAHLSGHLPFKYALGLLAVFPVLQLLYSLNFMCFDLLPKKFGWYLVVLNLVVALAHLGRLYLVFKAA